MISTRRRATSNLSGAAAMLGLILLAVTLAGPLSRFIDVTSRWLDYPFNRPGSEGLIYQESLLLGAGGDIYAPITPSSFISGPYPPVYYALVAPFLSSAPPAFSTSQAESSALRPGRAISLLSALVAASALAMLVVFDGGRAATVWQVLRAAAGGLVGGALFLTLPQTLVWASRFRGDMLAVGLTAVGLALVTAGAGARTDRRGRLNSLLALGALAFALAFFTKQTALPGPLAAGAYLLLRDTRAGVKWAGLMLALVVVPFGVIDVLTGNWFYLKMVVYHSLPLSRTTLTRLLSEGLWRSQWPLLLVSLGYTAGRLARLLPGRGSREEAPALLIPLFVLASAAFLPTAGVIGADSNHLLWIGLAECAAAGGAVAWALTLNGQRRGGSPYAAAASTAILLGLLGYVVFTSVPSPTAYGPDLRYPSADEQQQMAKIIQYLRGTRGDAFYADDVGVLSLAGKPAPYNDPFTMTALARTGRWDESILREKLRRGEFTRLVLTCDVSATLSRSNDAGEGGGRLCRDDVFTRGVLEAIRDGYEVEFRDVLFTYVPRKQ